MISIGRFSTRTCQGLTRRDVPPVRRRGAVRPGADAAGIGERRRDGEGAIDPAGLARRRAEPPRPLRPQAEGAGRVSRAVRDDRRRRTPGVRFTELVPRLAARSDRFALVRSNVNFDAGHREAGSIALTGAAAAGRRGSIRPISARSWPDIAARGTCRRSSRWPAARSATASARSRAPAAGPGARRYQPVPDRLLRGRRAEHPQPAARRGADPGAAGRPPGRPAGARPRPARADIRRRCRCEPVLGRLAQKAHALLSSPATHAALDLSREPEALREAYGRTSFGQSCLLGRRLVEAGVPYVQVNWSQYVEVFYPFSDYGWDTHADNFGLLADWHGPLLDRVFSTLLDDLGRRGLLETTLVVCMGEFGRTPRINAIGSRDHWPQCYFSIWAGAGVQAGRVDRRERRRGASTPPPTRSRRRWSAPPCWIARGSARRNGPSSGCSREAG